MLSKNILAVAAAAAPALAASNMSLSALIASDSRLSTLGTILKTYPDVANSLGNATNVTIFAPTNSGFTNYLASHKNVSLSSISQSLVAALLDYHVVNGTYLASNISKSPEFVHTFLNSTNYTTVEHGQVLELQTVDGSVVVTSGYKTQNRVVQSNLNYTNGIVHVIDGVNVIPPNYTDIASAANLTYFLGALDRANLTSTLASLDDVTIFAPTNDAFEAVGSIFGNMSTSKLADILKAHVINGTIAYSPAIGNGTVKSLGGKLKFTVADGAIFADNARIINADNLISNGVLQIVDAVINPNSTAKVNPSDDNPQNAYTSATSVSVLTEFVAGVPKATTTVANLVTTTLDVASGYSTVTVAIDSSIAGGPGATSKAGAPVVTAAVGMAALFGGAALALDF